MPAFNTPLHWTRARHLSRGSHAYLPPRYLLPACRAQPNLEPSVANADVSGERLVSEVLNSISKPAQHAPAGAGPYGGYAPPPSAAPAGGAYGMNAGGGGFNSRRLPL